VNTVQARVIVRGCLGFLVCIIPDLIQHADFLIVMCKQAVTPDRYMSIFIT